MGLTEPICIIGASMGGSIISIFATKYPQYVSMFCLLAPIGKFRTIVKVSMIKLFKYIYFFQ
jgi:alpha-beta hydrolase superfamily lysophospholipase